MFLLERRQSLRPCQDSLESHWKGPARVLMREDDSEGRPQLYWLSHKSQLLRCAPHHLRPAIDQDTTALIEGLQHAKRDVAALRSRGVTRVLDLNVVNRQRLEHVESEEGEDLELEEEEDTQPPLQRRRLDAPAGAPQVASPSRTAVDAEMIEDTAEYSPTSPAHGQHQPQAEQEPKALPSERPTPEPLAEITDSDAELPAVPPSEPSEEPSPPPSTALHESQYDHQRQSLIRRQPLCTKYRNHISTPVQQVRPARDHFIWQSPCPNLRCASRTQHRARQQNPAEPSHGAGPYDKPATGPDALEGCSFELDDLDNSLLPPGWHVEDGYITLDAQDQALAA